MVKNDNEYQKQYMKKYIADSKQVICPCGGKYKGYRLSSHNKTKRHMHYKTLPEKVDEKTNDSIDDLKKEIELLKDLIKNKL